MGSGAKIALVAILILMVVAVARFVQNGKEDDGGQPGAAGAKAAAGQNAAKKDAGPRLATPRSGGAAVAPKISSRQQPAPLLAGVTGGSSARPGEPVPAAGGNTAARDRAMPSSEPAPRAADAAPPIAQGSAAAAPLVQSSAGSAPTAPAITGGPTPGTNASGSTVGGTIAPPPAIVDSSGSPAPAPRLNLDAPSRPFPKVADDPAPPSKPSGPESAETPGKAVAKSFDTQSGSGAGSKARTESAAAGFPISHQVEPGDSYWRIAERYYGHGKGKLHTVIALANGGAKLVVGKTIQVPAPPPETAVATTEQGKTEKKAVKGAGGVMSSDARYDYYAVQKGDTLSGLARRFYGNATRTKAIEDANPTLRYEALREGARIRIPKE